MYSKIGDWPLVFEDIQDFYVGTQGSMMGSFIFRKINEELRSLGVQTPVGTLDSTGDYPQSLADWEINWACYQLIKRRVLGESLEIPEWLNSLYGQGTLIKQKIKKGQIVLQSDLSPFNSGIQPPQRGSSNFGNATLYNNYDGFNGPTTATDFTRKYIIKIATQGTSLLSSWFDWSWDGGVSWFEGTYCSTQWVSVGSSGERDRNIWIRFEDSGSGLQASMGDRWSFIVYPDYLIIRGDQDKESNWVSRKRFFS